MSDTLRAHSVSRSQLADMVSRWLALGLALCAANAQPPPAKYEQVSGPVEHGEGPHWSDEQQALYWVDIPRGDVWRLHPESGNITKCHLGGDVTVIVPVKGQRDAFVVGVGDVLQLLTWDGRNESTTALRPLTGFGELPEGARLNDGKADVKGRMWVGTIGPEVDEVVVEHQATFYRVACEKGEPCPRVTEEVANVSVSNGLAWSADGAILYYVDSPTRKIDAFDFEAENGTISNRRTVFDLALYNISGVPDGMTIDADDNLWIALYGGGAIIEINPHLSRLLQTFPLEGISRLTSVSWGSKDLDVLYVTTSGRGGGGGGQLYKLVGTGVRGRPAHDFSLDKCQGYLKQ